MYFPAQEKEIKTACSQNNWGQAFFALEKLEQWC
jgi:hypothetical protein